MGIKHFFYWFKRQFSHNIYKLKKNQVFGDVDVDVDNLMIDMNGIFHQSTQKIYKYGNCKPRKRLLRKHKINPSATRIKVFKDVCETVRIIFNIVKPNKRIILCVDGPAPLGKQNQQRQRRFRSAMERKDTTSFDSNCITPGTKFMDYLTKYIDRYIRLQVSNDPRWKNIEVVFSSEKVPGEGEHKIINYIRHHGVKTETYCIHGLDADLIMLALGTHLPNFYIFREDLYDPRNAYFCINIGKIHNELAENIRWRSDKHVFSVERAINDFIFLCFTVGNDFLPHIPSIEIIENGIELILEIYKDVGTSYGHITHVVGNNVEFIPATMKIFFGTVGHREKSNFERKLAKKRSFFPDAILNKCSTQGDDGWGVDIDMYIAEYMGASFPAKYDEEKLCHEYLEGMQWVLSYYTRGVPNWEWYYSHHYAPPASVLAKYLSSFEITKYGVSKPSMPFQQLLSVLPPKSANLIPSPLCDLLTDEKSPLKKYCPADITIDLSGKRKEWEGIVILPMVRFADVIDEYTDLLKNVNPIDKQRNVYGRSLIYRYDSAAYAFHSYYGGIKDCHAKTQYIKL